MRDEDPFRLNGPVEVIGHRGFSAVAPENTLSALESALEHGATALEFDLRPSRNGAAVLMHDQSLARTTDGTGSVGSWTVPQLAQLDAGSWFDARFRGEPVPTFAQAATGPGRRAQRLYPELKGLWSTEALQGLIDEARRADVWSRCIFIAIDWETLDRLRALEPQAMIGYVIDRADRVDEAFERCAADHRALLDFDARILLDQAGLVERAGRRHLPMATWTVNDLDTAQALYDAGMRRFTTNEVARLHEWSQTL